MLPKLFSLIDDGIESFKQGCFYIFMGWVFLCSYVIVGYTLYEVLRYILGLF